MLERFTADARAVVVGAQAEARRRSARCIGTEHLLLAALRDDALATMLQPFGLNADAIDADLDRLAAAPATATPANATDEPFDGDGERLASLGIDLDQVRSAVEGTFGEGALARATPATGSRWHRLRPRWRRPRGDAARPPTRSGHIPFSRHGKKALEVALREALRLGHRGIGVEHLLLGMLRDSSSDGDGLTCRLLADRAVPLDTLRAALERSARARNDG